MEEYKWLLVGSTFLITGIRFYFLTNGIRKNGIKTQARIKYQRLDSDGDDSLRHAVFEFEDQNGNLYNPKSMFGSKLGIHNKGGLVEVLYDKNDPNKILPNKFFLLNIYLLPLIFGLILITVHFLV